MEVDEDYDALDLANGAVLSSPLKVKKGQGKKAYDIVRLQDTWNFLISERLRHSMEESRLSGWKTYEIRSDDLQSGYAGFQCIGKCGDIIMPETLGFVVGCGFDMSVWDGSDFFTPESTRLILCTERAKTVLDGMKIKTLVLEDIQTATWYNH